MKCSSWLGHRYRPRFNSEPSVGFEKLRVANADMARAVEPLFVKKTYVADVCERCGNVVHA